MVSMVLRAIGGEEGLDCSVFGWCCTAGPARAAIEVLLSVINACLQRRDRHPNQFGIKGKYMLHLLQYDIGIVLSHFSIGSFRYDKAIFNSI